MAGARVLLLAAALALGAAAVPAYAAMPASRWAPDLAVGVASVVLSLLTWRTTTTVPVLALVVASSWWAGTLWSPALYWHRAALVLLVLGVPRAWPRSRVGRVAVVAGCVASLAPPVWQSEVVAIGLALALAGAGAVEARTRVRRVRHTVAPVLLSAAFVVGLLVPRLVGPEHGPGAALVAYDALVVLVLVVVRPLGRRPTRAELTDLVVDLGTPPVRDLAELTALVRAEPGLASEASMMDALAAARRLETARAGLQDQVRSALAEVERSRQRLVVAASQERARLAGELAVTAVEPLRELVAQAEQAGVAAPGLARAAEGLDAAVQGLRPPALSGGLAAALRAHPLAQTLGAGLLVSDARWDDVAEDILYAVATECLTNAAKHAGASTVEVRCAEDGAGVRITVVDDGPGGADIRAGTGLAGLVDRVEALGGHLEVTSRPGTGTSVTAWVPGALSGRTPSHRPSPSTPEAS